MDTRDKILTLGEARRLPGPVTIAAGYFDVLRVTHARDLAAIKQRAQTLVAGVLPNPDELLSQAARAELVAALGCIDYVVAAAVEELAALSPAEFLRISEDSTDLFLRVSASPR